MSEDNNKVSFLSLITVGIYFYLLPTIVFFITYLHFLRIPHTVSIQDSIFFLLKLIVGSINNSIVNLALLFFIFLILILSEYIIPRLKLSKLKTFVKQTMPIPFILELLSKRFVRLYLYLVFLTHVSILGRNYLPDNVVKSLILAAFLTTQFILPLIILLIGSYFYKLIKKIEFVERSFNEARSTTEYYESRLEHLKEDSIRKDEKEYIEDVKELERYHKKIGLKSKDIEIQLKQNKLSLHLQIGGFIGLLILSFFLTITISQSFILNNVNFQHVGNKKLRIWIDTNSEYLLNCDLHRGSVTIRESIVSPKAFSKELEDLNEKEISRIDSYLADRICSRTF
ncbi:MAG: hypothetical protein CME62_14885 [Halobacteriovoraceae bacterium]|nr:hypothetical protein [Halobacteriovoraceae bacterium]|tara:strand:- start:7547 stop:8569 length:1023 start_codon:yes stop_codon:yes gene_type:complete